MPDLYTEVEEFSFSRLNERCEGERVYEESAYTWESARFTVDADGNLTQDGRWTYVWDAENRLTSMTALTTIPDAAKKKLEFTYDYMGRRISKKTYTWDAGTLSYALQATRLFVYDGWNLVAELNANGTALRTYTWGQDLSGSMGGAGGVGGLLAINNTSDASTHFVTVDGNGNVMALLNADTGVISAEMEYGPFGELIKATGPMAKANPFGFSTKFTDSESGFLYYGYRYLNASTGRWLGRDPMEERGGYNLYALLQNDSINDVDVLGLEDFYVMKRIVSAEGGPNETPNQRRSRRFANKHAIYHTDILYGNTMVVSGFATRYQAGRGEVVDLKKETTVKLQKVNSKEKQLKWGKYKDTPCSCVTDFMRLSSLRASPEPSGDHMPAWNDCQTDVQDTIEGSCLSGYTASGSSPGSRERAIEKFATGVEW